MEDEISKREANCWRDDVKWTREKRAEEFYEDTEKDTSDRTRVWSESPETVSTVCVCVAGGRAARRSESDSPPEEKKNRTRVREREREKKKRWVSLYVTPPTTTSCPTF